jgi:hypothetical protein
LDFSVDAQNTGANFWTKENHLAAADLKIFQMTENFQVKKRVRSLPLDRGFKWDKAPQSIGNRLWAVVERTIPKGSPRESTRIVSIFEQNKEKFRRLEFLFADGSDLLTDLGKASADFATAPPVFSMNGRRALVGARRNGVQEIVLIEFDENFWPKKISTIFSKEIPLPAGEVIPFSGAWNWKMAPGGETAYFGGRNEIYSVPLPVWDAGGELSKTPRDSERSHPHHRLSSMRRSS